MQIIIQTVWNLVKIIGEIFIVDHVCEIMHKADKTGAVSRKLVHVLAQGAPQGLCGK